MLAGACQYPLLRERFWSTGEDASPGSASSSAPSSPVKGNGSSRPGLRVLDLKSLPQDDSPPTELRARKDKLAYFARRCSGVGHGLYIGAEAVAKNREVLRTCGISHVINCVGFLYPAYFASELEYMTLYLQDTPAEDITCILYDVFDFIQAATKDGCVLLHCSQGVSRSVSLAVAYLMWYDGKSYEEVFARVKEQRGIANPNIGFVCQLLQWHKKRHQGPGCGRLVRFAPQSPAQPQYLVPRVTAASRSASLDRRGAFVLQTHDTLFIWLGSSCQESFAMVARKYADQLQRYEPREGGALYLVEECCQGKEPEEFWEALRLASTIPAPSESSGASPFPSPAAPVADRQPEDDEELAGSRTVGEVTAYDKEFELYTRVLTGRSSLEASSSEDGSPRSARKTPREHSGADGPSPNERARKHARALEESAPVQEENDGSRTARGGSEAEPGLRLHLPAHATKPVSRFRKAQVPLINLNAPRIG